MAVIDCTFSSKVLVTNTKIKVVVPTTNLDQSNKYKVLYLLHGFSGDETDWMRFTNIELYSKKYNVVLVMPYASNSFYHDMKHGQKWYTYITEELPNVIKGLFPVSDDPKDTNICGLSMGGYGAMRIALLNQDKYNKVAVMSAALDINDIKNNTHSANSIPKSIVNNIFGDKILEDSDSDLFFLSKKAKLDIFMSCGTEDFLYDSNIKFHNHLLNQNIKHTYIENEAYGHTWDYWDMMSIEIMKWMYE